MKALLLWTAILLTVSGFYQLKDKYVKTEVTKDMTIQLPESFSPMPENVLNQKYLSARPPLAAYLSSDQQADLAINTSNARWQPEDLPMLKNFYRSNIQSLYDEVDFLNEEIATINGKDFAVFEFISLVRPEENALNMQKPVRKYTYIEYTIDKGKTYVFTFSAPAQLQKQWQETAEKIMGSVDIHS